MGSDWCCRCYVGNCICEHCADDRKPCCIRLTISGIADRDCTDCELLNQGWDLAHGFSSDHPDACYWDNPMCEGRTYSICGFDEAQAWLDYENEQYVLYAQIEQWASGQYIRWKAELGPEKPDCTSWDGVELEFDEQYTPGESSCCAGETSSATISARPGPECFCYEEDCGCRYYCVACLDYKMPRMLQVVLAGNGGPDDCEDWHGTYLLPVDQGCGTACGSIIDADMEGKCGCGAMAGPGDISAFFGGFGPYVAQVFGSCPTSQQGATFPGFLSSFEDPIDCLNFDEDLEPMESVPGINYYQDMTCRLTAIP